MKKVTLLSLILLFTASISLMAQKEVSGNTDSEKTEKKDGPIATYDKTVNDFGEIAQGIPKTAEFQLTNDGNEPLLVSYAKASCGCTNLQYSKDPVLPKKSMIISVTYNAAAPGNFIKTITIQTNADENKVVLQIKGKVIPKEQPAPVPEKK